MSCPISIGEAVSAVQTAYAAFKAIKEAPAKVNEIGHRLASLQSYLSDLYDLVDEKAPYGLAAKRPALIEDIKNVSDEVKGDAAQADHLLTKFKDQVQFGLEWKFKWVATAMFTAKDLGKLEDLIAVMDGRLVQINQQINLLNGFGIQELLAQQYKQGGNNKPSLSPKPSYKQNKQPSPSPSPKPKFGKLPGGGYLQPSPKPSPAPAPSPKPKFGQLPDGRYRQPSPNGSSRVYNRPAVNVIFIDPQNQARSVVAAAYLRVLKQLSEANGSNDIPVDIIHSAGLRVRSQSNVKNILEGGLGYMVEGGDAPNSTALRSLFENEAVRNLPFAEQLHQRFQNQHSRGVTTSLFTRYDYVIVFEEDWIPRMEKVKAAYGAKLGPQFQGMGTKGRIINLATYGSFGLPNIMDGLNPTEMGGVEYRHRWDGIVGKIAASVNGWLKKELNWEKGW